MDPADRRLPVLGMVGCNRQEAVVSGKNNEGLTLNLPKTETITAGDTAPVKLSITRKEFDGPVTIKFEQLPTGVTLVESDLTIPKGVTEKTFTLKAADNATGKGHAIKVSASAESMTAGPMEFVLNIKDKKPVTANPNNDDLALTVARTVTIHPGDTAPVKVSITRKHFDAPVTIKFEQLPMGVTVVESDRTIPKESNELTFNLKAADSATGQGHVIKVSASGDGRNTGPVDLTLNVVDKKAATLEQKRKDLEQEIRTSLDETNKNLTQLETRAKDAKGPAKAEADAAVVKLRKSQGDLKKRLDQAQSTSEDAWDNFSAGVHTSALDLQKASKQAWEKIKD